MSTEEPQDPAVAAEKSKDVIIYYNDSVDSDNITAALALLRHTERRRPDARIVWILEPRQVALGLGMTGQEIAECKGLIQEHFADRGNPFKVLLGGLLSQREIDGVQERLSEEQRKLLRMAIKPSYGSREDAVLHANLTAWDFATCLAKWSGSAVEVFIDIESLSEIENPVNLNLHHHEELVTRSKEEVDQYEAIRRNADLSQRRDSLRDWYKECILRSKASNQENGTTVNPLDFSLLRDEIQNSNDVRFMGGSSLRILRRFIETGVAHKIQCNLQVGKGSLDLSANLFPNQFNIALNPKAAKSVFEHFRQFAKFTAVPSHTAQNIKYPLNSLVEEGGRSLERKILGFNCHADPVKIAMEQVTLSRDHAGKASPMPDLTSFLCELQPGYMGAITRYARVVQQGETLLFEPDSAGIPMYDIEKSTELGVHELGEVWGSPETKG